MREDLCNQEHYFIIYALITILRTVFIVTILTLSQNHTNS
jgi:hypothetical protein